MTHNASRVSQSKEILLFLRRWRANPLRIGSVLPSSPSLTRLIARHAVTGDDGAVPGELLGRAPSNVPPASLWRFTRPEVIGNVATAPPSANDGGISLIR